jgi:hypothetical protein
VERERGRYWVFKKGKGAFPFIAKQALFLFSSFLLPKKVKKKYSSVCVCVTGERT